MLHVLLAASTLLPISKPIRSLVYNFSYKSAVDSGRGTIDANVMGAAADGSLIIRFSQTVDGHPNDTFAPAECAVFPDTRVLCRDQHALSPFENELGRLLGRKFIDGDAMDDRNHWRISANDQGVPVVSDFTVTSNVNGVLTITEGRDITVDAVTTHHAATIVYDMNRTVPTKLSYTDNAQSHAGVDFQVDYTLASDSMAKPLTTPK